MFKILYFWLLLNLSIFVSFGGDIVTDEKKAEEPEEMFPFEELGKEDNYSVDVLDDENLSTLSALLRSNIEQWHLAETQLADPDIHLSMPGISTPLQQLSMTLEILGNIYISRGDLAKARDTFEKACPLIELIVSPSSVEMSPFQSPGHSLDSRISSPQPQKHVDQLRKCFNQLNEVYSQLNQDSAIAHNKNYDNYQNFEHFKTLRSPYQRMRSEFELQKFLNDVVASLDFHSDTYAALKQDVLTDLHVFAQRYVHEFDGKISTLLNIFERMFTVTPADLPERSVVKLHDLLDECMDMIFKQVWDSAMRHQTTYFPASGVDDDSPSPEEMSAAGGGEPSDSELSSSSATEADPTMPPSLVPSLAAAPAPGVMSPSFLAPVIRGLDSTSALDAEMEPNILAMEEMLKCLRAGDKDCSQLSFPSASEVQRIVKSLMTNRDRSAGANRNLFNDDGSFSKNVMDQLQKEMPHLYLHLNANPPVTDSGSDSSASSSRSNTLGRKKRQKRAKGNGGGVSGSTGDGEDSGNDQDLNSSFAEESTIYDTDPVHTTSGHDEGDSKASGDKASPHSAVNRKPAPAFPNETSYVPTPSLQMNLVFWQWVRMQPPQPTPLASVKVVPPSPSYSLPVNSQSTIAGRSEMRMNSEAAGVLFESSTTAGQSAAPRAAVSNVRANNTAVLALVFSVIALCLGVAYLNYTHQATASLRRKHKRIPKRTFAQYVEESVEYTVQISQDVVYPFVCYLAKQFAGLFVSGYSRLLEYMSRMIVSKDSGHSGSHAKSGTGGGSKGTVSVVSTSSTSCASSSGGGGGGGGGGSIASGTAGGKKPSSPASQTGPMPISSSLRGAAALGPSSVPEHLSPSPALTIIPSIASTSSSASSTSSASTSSTSSTSSATSSMPAAGGTKPARKRSVPSAVAPIAGVSGASDLEGWELGGDSKQVCGSKVADPPASCVTPPTTSDDWVHPSVASKHSSSAKSRQSNDEVVSLKKNGATPVSQPTQSSSTSSQPLTKQNKSSVATILPAPVPIVTKNAPTSSGKGNTQTVGVSNKFSPKSVVLPPQAAPFANPAPPVATASLGKKKIKSSSSAGPPPIIPPTTATTTTTTTAPISSTAASKPIPDIPVVSSNQENVWTKPLDKFEFASQSTLSNQASADSYDDLLQFMKRTTVDSISIDDEDDRRSKPSLGYAEKGSSSRSKMGTGLSARAGAKPFPYPSPIVTTSTPSLSLTPSCDISPHSALRIAPGISSDMFTAKGVGITSATSPTASSSGSAPLKMNMNVSPKVSGMTSSIPELDKAPSEIAPGLSASLLTSPARKLAALNESSSEALPPVLGGLGFTPSTSRRLSETSRGSAGVETADLDLYNSPPLFPLRNVDSIFSDDSGHVDSVSKSSPSPGVLLGNTSSQLPRNQLILPPAASSGAFPGVAGSSAGAASASSSGTGMTSINDIFGNELFSGLNKDSPVFCSANYPSSVPPGVNGRGSVGYAPHSEPDSQSFNGYVESGFGMSPPLDFSGDFSFSHDRDNLSSGSGMGYGLFGNSHNPFGGVSHTYHDSHPRDDEDSFWKKNNQSSKMLLGSSLLEDDYDAAIDDDDLFHFASQGTDRLSSDLFDDDSDELLQSSLWLNIDPRQREGGGLGGHHAAAGPDRGPSLAPPGFSPPSTSQSALGGSAKGGDGNALSQGLLAYAPKNSSSLLRRGGSSGSGHGGGMATTKPRDQLAPFSMSTQHHHDANHLPLANDNSLDQNDDSEIVTLSFTVKCGVGFRHPLQVVSVCMASSLFGRWSLDHALPMRQSGSEANVYGINVEVPEYLPYFTFKYIITDVNGKMWMEHGPPVIMNVGLRLQQYQQNHKQRRGSFGHSERKIILEQDDLLRSYVSVPPGNYLYGNNE